MVDYGRAMVDRENSMSQVKVDRGHIPKIWNFGIRTYTLRIKTLNLGN